MITNMEKKYNDVTTFMWYVFNRWCMSEACHLFGDDLGAHIFAKWEDYGAGRELLWYSELDTRCRQRLVDRANEIYNK